MQLARILDLEYADVLKLSRHPPQMYPLPFQLQRPCPLVLLCVQTLDPLGVQAIGEPNRHIHMERHNLDLLSAPAAQRPRVIPRCLQWPVQLMRWRRGSLRLSSGAARSRTPRLTAGSGP